MDDGVVGTEVDALQDVLLRSLVLHIVLIPDDHHDDDDDDDDEYFILSTEVYLRVVVYVAPNLNISSNVLSLKKYSCISIKKSCQREYFLPETCSFDGPVGSH